MNTTEQCVGASVAVLVTIPGGPEQVVAIQRDEKPDIAYPGAWELLGGGAEPGEDIVDCALREGCEESGLELDASDVLWVVRYPLSRCPGAYAGFVVVRAEATEVTEQLRLGDEGQNCTLMPLSAFLSLEPEAVVPAHQDSLLAFFVGRTSGIIEVDRVNAQSPA